MWQFAEAVRGLADGCAALGVPVTGGNVSFYNETLGEGIYPTPVVGVVGILEDVHKAAKMHFAQPGRKIILLRADEDGDAVDAEAEFGSSEYAKEVLGAVWGYPPQLNLEEEAALQHSLLAMIREGLVESAHDCADGGLAVALVECALPGNVGFRVNLTGRELPPEFVLFGEDASRVLLSCEPVHLTRIQHIVVEHALVADVLGETGSGPVEIALDGQPMISASIAELCDAYEGGLERALKAESVAAA